MLWKNKFIEEGVVGKSRADIKELQQFHDYFLHAKIVPWWRDKDLPADIHKRLESSLSNFLSAFDKYKREYGWTWKYYQAQLPEESSKEKIIKLTGREKVQ